MVSLRKSSGVVLLLVCLALFAHSNAAQAAAIFTDSAAFAAQLAPGNYLETFAGLPQNSQLPSTLLFTGGTNNAFSYNAVARDNGGLFASSPTAPLDTFFNGGILGFDFLSGNVTAVGGFFFSTNINGLSDAGAVTLVLSDGTTVNLATTSPTSFVGFISSVPITSLNVTPSLFVSYATVANFDVGANIPEPATFWLGGALIALGLLRKRFSK